MRAGKLRHRVTLQTPTGTQDTYGQPVETWADTAVIWASVEPLSGQERLQAQQLGAETTHRVRVRHRTDITAVTRLQFGSRLLEINAVLEAQEKGAELELMCREIT